MHFGDLHCDVHLDGAPEWAARELPELYHSSYSVVEYFSLYNGVTEFDACVLTEPTHIVLFTHAGRTATVLNQLFDIDPDSLRRVCAGIFRALPQVRRIRFNGSRLDPAPLALPTRTVAHSEDMVVRLPSDHDGYFAALGTATRRNLRKYSNRLERAHPDHRVVVRERAAISADLVHRLFELQRRRLRDKGDRSIPTSEHERREFAFLQHHGLAVTMELDGEVVAGTLGSRVGRDYYGHVQTFDIDIPDFRLGKLCMMHTILECIDRGVRDYHFLWGRNEYKGNLGARPQELCAFVAYRSWVWRALHLDDAVRAARWQAERSRAASRLRSAKARAGRIIHRRAGAPDSAA